MPFFDELVLAYAITIHKSQESEYPVVVMPILMTHYVMLQRNLIYTGVTRAKKVLVMVGTKKAVSLSVRNVTVDKRNTLLAERIRTSASTEQSASTEDISRDQWLRMDLFERLSKSEFRMRFKLSDTDKAYLREKGSAVIRSHAEEIVRKRLAPVQPQNDGKQTPMRCAPEGHPVFLAQHATATCCRSCMEKWHGIRQGRELAEQEQSYIVDVLMKWLSRQFD